MPLVLFEKPATFRDHVSAEMLRELEPLRLVVRAEALAVERCGPLQHSFIDQAADNLSVLQNEGYFARAYFENRPCTAPAGRDMAEPGIEEAGIVHTELSDQRIERHHLSGVVRRHLHGLFRGQDVELIGVE